jgi:hypothetical protein
MRTTLAILLLFICGGGTQFAVSDGFWWRLTKAKGKRATCMTEAIVKAKGNGRCGEMSDDVIKSASLAIFQCLMKRFGRQDMNLCNPNSRFSFKECLAAENADDNVVTHIELLRSRVMVMCFLLHDAEVSSYIAETAKGLRGELRNLNKVKSETKVQGEVVKKCSAIFEASSALKTEAQLDLRLARSNAEEIRAVKLRLEEELELIQTVGAMTETSSAAGLSQIQKARNLLREAMPPTREPLTCATMRESWRTIGLVAHLFAFVVNLVERARANALDKHSLVKGIQISTAHPQKATKRMWRVNTRFALFVILDMALCAREVFSHASSEKNLIYVRSASVVNSVLSSIAERASLKLARRAALRRNRSAKCAVIEDSACVEE